MNDTLPQWKFIQLIQISVEENLTNPGHVYSVIAHAHYSKSPTATNQLFRIVRLVEKLYEWNYERVKFWLILWFWICSKESTQKNSVWSDKRFHLFENNIIKSFSFSLTNTTTSWLICWPRSPLFFQHSSVIPFTKLPFSLMDKVRTEDWEKFRFHDNRSWKQLAKRVSSQGFLYRSWRFARGFVVNPWQRKPYPLITAS